jgi:hypothetical protein
MPVPFVNEIERFLTPVMPENGGSVTIRDRKPPRAAGSQFFGG